MAHEIGSIEAGKLADLVLWSPAFFGVKPDLVIKGGMHRVRADGRSECLDPDAAAGALPADVRRLRPRAGGDLHHLRLRRRARCRHRRGLEAAAPLVPVANTRGGIGKRSMIHNDATPVIEVDAETYEVRADGVLLTCEPATVLPMAQRYFLF